MYFRIFIRSVSHQKNIQFFTPKPPSAKERPTKGPQPPLWKQLDLTFLSLLLRTERETKVSPSVLSAYCSRWQREKSDSYIHGGYETSKKLP